MSNIVKVPFDFSRVEKIYTMAYDPSVTPEDRFMLYYKPSTESFFLAYPTQMESCIDNILRAEIVLIGEVYVAPEELIANIKVAYEQYSRNHQDADDWYDAPDHISLTRDGGIVITRELDAPPPSCGMADPDKLYSYIDQGNYMLPLVMGASADNTDFYYLLQNGRYAPAETQEDELVTIFGLTPEQAAEEFPGLLAARGLIPDL